MDAASSGLIAALLAAVLLAALDAGRRVNGWLIRRRGQGAEAGGVGVLVGAALGLLSLLIGFTLALSLDRYEARRDLVVQEAGAILTVWQRDQMLPAPYRQRLDGLLRDYVRERRALASVGLGAQALDAADARTGALQQAIWDQTAAALRAPEAAPLVTTVFQATGVMLDLPAARRAELDAQVPSPVLWTVAIVAVMAAAITGYGLAGERRFHAIPAAVFFVTVALALTLVFELDEPRAGLIRVPQAPLDRAAATMLGAPKPP